MVVVNATGITIDRALYGLLLWSTEHRGNMNSHFPLWKQLLTADNSVLPTDELILPDISELHTTNWIRILKINYSSWTNYILLGDKNAQLVLLSTMCPSILLC